MSHDATAWAKARKTGSSPAKFILMVLADFAGTDYSCYPSVKKLAEITELGESTVRAATKQLAEQGLIRVFYRYRDNRTRRSCRYQLLVDGPETMEPDAEDWASHRQLSEEGHRQEPAGTRQEPADSHRQELALIPDKDPSLRDPSAVTPAASRSKTATRVPEDFAPDEKMRAWYAAQQFGDTVNGPQEHDKFMDYWRAQPGMKGRKTDWPATWRNWMREASERAQRRGYRQPGNALVPTSGAPVQYKPSTTDQRIAQGQALAAKYREQGL